MRQKYRFKGERRFHDALVEFMGLKVKPPNFKLPKRCDVCVNCRKKGWFRIKRRCMKYGIDVGGIGCCDSYEWGQFKK